MTFDLMPPGGLSSLRKEMDQLIDSMWREDLPEATMAGPWAPKVDLSETKDQMLVRAEVPGLDPNDLKVEYRDGLLTIRGEKKRELEHKNEQFYRRERTYGAFSRTLRLPAIADPKRVEATFKQGVLQVTLPKAAEAVGTSVPVKVTP
jgi:HSP20 family protein